MIHELCHSLKNRDSMVEIGAGGGKRAVIFAQYFKSVICVDPWDQGDVFTDFLTRTLPHKNIRYLIMTSEEASDSFPIESLSFVYINGFQVARDIRIWRSKISEGGRMGGSRYYDPRISNMVGTPLRTYKEGSWLI